MSTIDKHDIKPIPVSKRCKLCKEDKLLSEYDFLNNKKNRRLAICKSCMEQEEDTPSGGCCQEHFVEMTIHNSFIQLDNLLDMIEASQYNDVEIPSELLHRMLKIVLDSGHFDLDSLKL